MVSSFRNPSMNYPLGPRTTNYASSFAPRGGGGAGGAGTVPGMYPLPAGGGGSAVPPTLPLPQPTFQKSVTRERATTAQPPATFASMPPLPKAPDGQYDGAYGKGAAGEQAATAARAAYVDRQHNVANAQDFGQGT